MRHFGANPVRAIECLVPVLEFDLRNHQPLVVCDEIVEIQSETTEFDSTAHLLDKLAVRKRKYALSVGKQDLVFILLAGDPDTFVLDRTPCHQEGSIDFKNHSYLL